MKTQTQSTKVKKVKSLDEEIAAAQERLTRLQAQKREKERKDLEKNQKAIAAFLRAEKLDTVPVEKWTEALAALRKVLKVEEPKAAAQTGSGPGAKSGTAETGVRSGTAETSAESENAGQTDKPGVLETTS